jgi:putative membrane protein
MDLLGRIIGMIVLRPYVFVFFGVYLILAVSRLGWKRTTIFSLIAYAVAFTAEFSSTRTGVPFGLYHYIDVTRDRELWISNVPFWDSLSFTFLCYLGWRLGVLLYAPIAVTPGDVRVVDTRAIAGSWRACLAGALLMTWLDVVIDPLTVHGDRWFLGKMYYYPEGGVYFGVPLSNFLGWFVVGVTTTRMFQWWDERQPLPANRPRGARDLPYSGLLEPLVYVGILVFNLFLTFWIGETLLGLVGVAIFTPVLVLLAIHVLDRRRRATEHDLAAHARDFGMMASRSPRTTARRSA